MDLAKDIINIATKASPVPGLDTACSLALQIIKTAQISKNNTARLQYLAHFVAIHLTTIAENMKGNWDDMPHKLKERIDEFEMVLQNILKIAKKYSKSSRVLAFVNAGDRDMDITRLEQRLGDVQGSILLILGIDTSVVVAEIQSVLKSQQAAGLDILSDLRLLQLPPERSEPETSLSIPNEVSEEPGSDVIPHNSDNNELVSYSRTDVCFTRTITRHWVSPSRDATRIAVTLREATRSTDGRVILVKTYEGSQSNIRAQLFNQVLNFHRTVWDQSILQLVGASRATASIPFQVYHAPAGDTDNFGEWLTRTLHENPVETICNLYGMRDSIKVLQDFQKRQRITCEGPIFWYSVVNVQPYGDQLRSSLIYTGELSSGDPLYQMPHEEYTPWLNLPSRLSNRSTEESTLAAAFCGGSRTWATEAYHSEIMIKCSLGDMDIYSLGSALFEKGYLGPCRDVYPYPEPIALGDIGYILTEDSHPDHKHFQVITNVHNMLVAQDGHSLTWGPYDKEYHSLSLENGIILDHSGNAYQRGTYVEQLPNIESMQYYCYENLDETQAWKTLQKKAREIVETSGLSIAPHQLQLVISMGIHQILKTTHFHTHVNMDRSQYALQEIDSGTDILDENLSPVGSTSSTSPVPGRPPMYVFEQVARNHCKHMDRLDLRQRCVSFEMNPTWLKDEVWPLQGEETSEGFRLKYKTLHHTSEYLQLPPGVALPYIAEM